MARGSRPSPAPTNDKDDEDFDNQNRIRQGVAQPYQLQGKSDVTDRRRENWEAIGGMRHPRNSLRKSRVIKKVGAEVARALDGYLDTHGHLQKEILSALGDSTKTHRGPNEADIRAAARRLELFFHLPAAEFDKLRTQPNQPIYKAWV